MNIKIFLLTIVIFLLFIQIGFSIDDALNVSENESVYRGIVVYKSSHKTMQQAWNNDKTEIDDTIKFNGGKIGFKSEEYSHFYVDVPKENYTETLKDLKEKGYEVRDELIYKPFLNESLASMSAPYTCFDPSMVKFNLTGNGRKIGIIDTGIDPTHQDFTGRISAWYDAINNNTVPNDWNGHGTHCAGIAAGNGDASNGKFVGVAPNANLVIAKGCNVTNNDAICNERFIEDAINWMISQNVDVISMSLGTTIGYLEDYRICKDMTVGVNAAIQNAISHGIIVIAAAGNEGPLAEITMFNSGAESWKGAIIHPACLKDVIAVGMSYKKDYENFSVGIDSNEGQYFTSKIHLIIEVNGVVERNLEWEAINNNYVDFLIPKTGLDITITPSSWPANVKIKFEGLEKVTAWHPAFGSHVVAEKWWPGTDTKGDAFWEDNYTFNQGHQIVIQFSAWPVVAKTDGQVGWIHWHAYFYKNETDFPIGVKYHNIYYNVFSTTKSLTDVSSFITARGEVKDADTGGLIKYYPDVTAPGYLICAANSSQQFSSSSFDDCMNSQYQALFGTSMATPHIAGLVALIKEANPSASYDEIRNTVIETADLAYSDSWKPPYYFQYESLGSGRINATKAVNSILKPEETPTGGYTDSTTNPDRCTGHDYDSYSSANQIRKYIRQCPYPNYNCNVTFDSFIESVCVNGNCGSDIPVDPYKGLITNDVFVHKSSNIEVQVKIKNTGELPQWSWFVGVEFWNVSNFSNPTGSRNQNGRINAYYSGNSINMHGCIDSTHHVPFDSIPGNCPSGVDCSLVSESSPNPRHILYPGETLTVKCWAPASFYPISNNYFISWCDHCGTLDGIMFWVHAGDLSQDAGNNGNYGMTWGTDALARSFRPGADDPITGGPTKVKVAIVSILDSDGKNYFIKGSCTDTLPSGPRTLYDVCGCLGDDDWFYCMSNYVDKASCESDPKCWWGLSEKWPSGNNCQYCFKNCKDFGSSYTCFDGKCSAFETSITSPINSSYHYKTYVPLTFTIDRTTSWIGYSLDYQLPITVSGPFNLTNLPNGLRHIILYANDTSGNVGSSNDIIFYYCQGNVDGNNKVDIKDVALVAKRFGSACGDPSSSAPKYDAVYDLDNNCKVDIKDVSTVAKQFGKSC